MFYGITANLLFLCLLNENSSEEETIMDVKSCLTNVGEKYADLNERLLFGCDVHYPDNCIVLDAHDLSLTDCIDLEFISADRNMIESVTKWLACYV